MKKISSHGRCWLYYKNKNHTINNNLIIEISNLYLSLNIYNVFFCVIDMFYIRQSRKILRIDIYYFTSKKVPNKQQCSRRCCYRSNFCLSLGMTLVFLLPYDLEKRLSLEGKGFELIGHMYLKTRLTNSIKLSKLQRQLLFSSSMQMRRAHPERKCKCRRGEKIGSRPPWWK